MSTALTYALAAALALLASVLTFFTGFGLGTILLPALVLVLPVQLAIAATALVHFANNIFKLTLVGKHANKTVLLRFGLPALLSALAGAALLNQTLNLPALASFTIQDKTCTITPIKLVIGLLMAFFAMLDLSKLSEKWLLPPKYMPMGGLLSGFFGGLSGHQGAFRTMFLLKAGLSKEELIGTGAAIGFLVDLSRLTVYSEQICKNQNLLTDQAPLLVTTIVLAMVGSIVGSRLLKKVSVTVKKIELAAAVLLLATAIALCLGLV